MLTAPPSHRLFAAVLLGALGIGLSASRAAGIVPPRPGTGARLPLSRADLVRRRIGQPTPVPPRLLRPGPGPRARARVEGVYNVPVLLGLYAGASPEYPPEDFQTMLFDGPFERGTMADYFTEISYGLFTVDGTVYGWIGVPGGAGYYERGCNGFCGGFPNNAGGFVYHLAAAADSAVDYGLYDNDGPDGLPNSGDDDGYVDAVFAVHPGTGGECGGPVIWSHRSSIEGFGGPSGGYLTDDASLNGGYIRVNDYIIMPEISCDGMSLIEIGVYCHEFGHTLNLPDLYDGDGTSQGVGGWCLMGSGSYGGNQTMPWSPSHMCAWSKMRLGWVDPEEIVTNPGVVAFPRAETHPFALRLWAAGDYSGPEYFLVENRQILGFDRSLPGPGLLIWHIDDSRPHNGDESHKLVDLEEADGSDDLDHNLNRGDGADPYPGGAQNRTFDWTTYPNSNSYAGAITEVSVTEISDPDTVMTARVTIRAPRIASFTWRLDDPLGDGDGVADPGEEAQVTFTVRNEGPTPATGVWARLSTEDPQVAIVTDSVFMGEIPAFGEAGNAGAPFHLAVDAASPVHRASLRLELSGDDQFSYRQDLVTMIGHPRVLLVDDTGEDGDLAGYYEAALDSLGVPFILKGVGPGAVGGDSLAPFEVVIWFTGGATSGLLLPEDQDSLRAHLGRGGRLVLTGQNIVEELASTGSPFLPEVLHLGYGGTAADAILEGVPGDPITGTLARIATAGSRGANNQRSRDILVAGEGAAPIAYYDTAAGTVGGVRISDPGSGAKMVMLGFGFEAVNRPSADTLYATRRGLLSRVLAWFEAPVGVRGRPGAGAADAPGQPRGLSLGPGFPNPFRTSTLLALSIPSPEGSALTASGPPSRAEDLAIYSVRGERVRTLLSAPLPAGPRTILWDGRDERGRRVAAGIYFARLRAGNSSVTRKLLLLE